MLSELFIALAAVFIFLGMLLFVVHPNEETYYERAYPSLVILLGTLMLLIGVGLM